MHEAAKAMEAFKAKGKNRRDPLAAERISFEDLAEDFVKKYLVPMKSASYARTAKGLLLNHLVPYFGDYRIGEIGQASLYDYLAGRLQENVINRTRTVSESTLNRETALLRHILSMAVKWDYLDVNPLLRVEMFHEDPRRRVLPLPLLREMIDRCYTPGKFGEATMRLKHVLVVALNTGMRKEEILGLTWDRVNFDTRFITLVITKGKKPREVWMNDALLDLMQRLHGQGEQQIVGPVFPNPKTGKPQKDIKQAWSGLLKRIGIEDFRFHDLRRCWSTYTKGDLALRQQGMGHRSIMTTAGYTVPLEEEMKKMYDSFQVWETEDKVIEFPVKNVL